MSDEDYSTAIGKLVRLKVHLKPSYHSAIDEIVDSLVEEAEKI